jgi:hypothetical protein
MANGRDDAPHKFSPHEFQAERVHKDFEESYNTARAAMQATILINGGAATAILAYLSKGSTPPEIVRAACVSFVLYGLGVLSAAYAMWNSSQAAGLFAAHEKKSLMAAFSAGQVARVPLTPVAPSPTEEQKNRLTRTWNWLCLVGRLIFDPESLKKEKNDEQIAWIRLDLHRRAFAASVLLFFVATCWMALKLS